MLSAQFSNVKYIYIVGNRSPDLFHLSKLKLYICLITIPSSPFPQPQTTTILMSASRTVTALDTPNVWDGTALAFP